jgi:hypothetical protein
MIRRFLSERPLPLAVIAAITAIAVVLVAMSLRRVPIEMYAPTPAAPAEVGDALVGPVIYTVDASSPDR